MKMNDMQYAILVLGCVIGIGFFAYITWIVEGMRCELDELRKEVIKLRRYYSGR